MNRSPCVETDVSLGLARHERTQYEARGSPNERKLNSPAEKRNQSKPDTKE
jgi:hypothetical protein